MKIALNTVLNMLAHAAMDRDLDRLPVEFIDHTGQRLELRAAEVSEDVLLVELRPSTLRRPKASLA